MNIRLGVYEIFSRIIPGSLYIFAVGQLLAILGVINTDWQVLNDLSIISLVGIVIVAYILSEALDRFALVWFRIFKKRGISTQVLASFKNKHQDKWDITFEDRDLSILIAYIRTKDLELAGEIERHNAISIMLRNISFGLLLITINTTIMFVFTRNIVFPITSFVLLIFSIIIIRESIKFRQWFYSSIFETIIAYRLELEKIVMPVHHKKSQKAVR